MLKIYLLGSCPTCEATEEQFRNIGYFGVSLQNMVPVGTTGSSSSSRKTGEWYNTIRFLFDFKFRPRGHRSLFSLLSSAGINLGLLLGINLGLFPMRTGEIWVQGRKDCNASLEKQRVQTWSLPSAPRTQLPVQCNTASVLLSTIGVHIYVYTYIYACVYIYNLYILNTLNIQNTLNIKIYIKYIIYNLTPPKKNDPLNIQTTNRQRKNKKYI